MDLPAADRTSMTSASLRKRLGRRLGFAACTLLAVALMLGILGPTTGDARASAAQVAPRNMPAATAMPGTNQGNMPGMSANQTSMPGTLPVTPTVAAATSATPLEPAPDIDATLAQVQEMRSTLQQTMAQLQSRAGTSPTVQPPTATPASVSTPALGPAGMGRSGPSSYVGDSDWKLTQISSLLGQIQTILNLMAGMPGGAYGVAMSKMPSAGMGGVPMHKELGGPTAVPPGAVRSQAVATPNPAEGGSARDTSGNAISATPITTAQMNAASMPASQPVVTPQVSISATISDANPMPASTPNMSSMPEAQPGDTSQPVATGTMAAAASMAGGVPMDQAVPDIGMQPATQTEGNQPLAFRLENGLKVFELTAQPVKWPISKAVTVNAWSFDGTVPGPMIRVTEGDRVRVLIKNQLPAATSIHWHGLPVPNSQDGVAQPPLTQDPIEPGQTFVYEFVAGPSGTHMYHSHVDTDRQVNIGLFGAVIIDPKEQQAKPDKDVTLVLNEWRYDATTDKTYPAMPGMGEPNYFTMNGKTYPDIPALNVKLGERVRLRLVNAGQFEHPMHLHGGSFNIVATDGNPVPELAQLTKDTVSVHPGERYDIEFVARNPGQWVFHCHILHHVTNDDTEPGGLLMVVNVR